MRTETRRDAHGIPHLQAPDVLALARLQGRVVAGDRAWQIELDRWRMEGRTAERLGAPGLAWDVFARQVRLEDTARAAYLRLSAETREWVDAFVDGVNEALPEAALGSVELRRLDATDVRVWEPWTPLGIFSVCHVLFGSFPTKLWRAALADRVGPEVVPLLGIEGDPGSGSNAVAVAGAHTASGRPLVAGDPHRLLEVPGVYAQVHLRCPELDVHGFTFPGVPGVQHFAHAGQVAWGITNAMADYQDLYLERLRPVGDGWQAEGPDGWEPVESHVETIHVGTRPAPSALSLSKGHPDPDADLDPSTQPAPSGPRPTQGVTVTCVRTPRGPVVTGLEPPELGLAAPPTHSLRAPSQVTSDLGFDTLLPLLRARSVADVEAALAGWVEPVNSVLVADASRVRHLLAGRVPDRDERLTRLPGRGWERADAWRGWRTPPANDVTAVEVNCNDRASGGGLGAEYAPPHRARRLRRVVTQSLPADAVAARGWAGDTLALAVGTARPFLAAADVTGGAAVVRERLLGWDGRCAAESEEAALFAAWRTALVRWFLEQPPLRGLGAPVHHSPLLAPWLDPVARTGQAWETLLTRGHTLGLDVAAGVRSALAAAAGTRGTWGGRHRLTPAHGLDDPATPDVGLAGDTNCVLATSSVPGVTDRCPRGPVARYVWDLDDRRRSGWVVPFGAAGDPGSDHHHDQLPLWLAGELVPLVEWDDLGSEEVQP